MVPSFLKNNYLILGVIGLIVISIFLVLPKKSEPMPLPVSSFQYYEDDTGKRALSQVQEKYQLGEFLPNSQNIFSFGKSSSTYWIRIALSQMDADTYKDYISIYNPTVTKAVLYLPIKSQNTITYKALHSGWSFGENKQDEGFFYPTFRWDEYTDFNQDAYIELYSDFTQNYRITFLTEAGFEQTKRSNYVLHASLFGILLAIVIQNLIIFIELKDKSYGYYFLYIFLMMIYQGTLLGVYNVFIPKFGTWMMANTIGWSFAVMLGSIVFFREFFRTKTLFVKYDVVLKGLMFCICLGWLFELLQQHVLANMYAHTLSNIGSLFMMFVAVCAYRKDFRQAKLFILGWIFMIVSLIVSFFRHVGIMDNNVITTNSTFIAVVLQSLLLSVALVQMIKILTIEKQKALEQYIAALENAQQQEMAYLHAQIKPHFLYNALNVIISLCRIDASRAGDLLLDLSIFLRHSFDFNKEQKLVYLKDELEYVKAYVHIEQARFRNKLDIVYELNEDSLLKIPSLVLQPLVENAIVHGIRNKEGTGKIVLRVIEEKEQYRVEVQDDGVGMTEEQVHQILSQQWYKGKGVGITNINQRLFKIFGQGLLIKSILGQGTTISFCVPKGADGC